MRLYMLLTVWAAILMTAAAEHRLRYFSENKAFALEVNWESETAEAQLKVFRCDTPEKEFWTSSFPIPFEDRWGLEGFLSDDGELAFVLPDSLSRSGPALVFLRQGKVVQQYAGGFIAGKISDENTSYPRDFLSRSHLAGAIHMFNHTSLPPLFCTWIGSKDHWFAVNLLTGDIIKPTTAQEAEWNRQCREKTLAYLNELAPGGPGTLGQTKAHLYKNGRANADFRREIEGYHPDRLVNLLKFLTRRRQPEDEAFLKGLLNAPLVGGGYSGGPFLDNAGPIPISLFTGSDLRTVGDMLLRQWEEGLEPARENYGENNYPGGGSYKYLGEAHGNILLPRAPRTNDGSLRIIMRPQAETNGLPTFFHWDFLTAVDMTTHILPWATNAAPKAILNKVDLRLRTLSPGQYVLDTLWARSRSKIGMNDPALPGDYFDSNRVFTVSVGEKVDIDIFCTNQLAGHEALYAADLRNWTNIPAALSETRVESPYLRKVRLARENGGMLAERALTNVVLGPLNARRITYGKFHKFLDIDHVTDENALVVWFDVKSGAETGMYDYEISGKRRESFHTFGGGWSSGGEREVTWVELKQWPRRDKTFVLTVRNEQKQTVGEVVLPNIAQTAFAELVPQRLPASTNIGSLNIVFKGIDGDDGMPIIELNENGGSAIGWEVGPDYFEDSLGNRAWSAEELLHERTLRCTVRLFRTQSGRFSKAEEWLVPLRVPEPGKYEVLRETRTIEGLEMTVVAIGGMGEITYDENRPIGGIKTVDPLAQPYRDFIPRFSNVQKPPVFIRGTGSDWKGPGQRTKTGRFAVVGTEPHLAIMAKNAEITHRIFVGSQTFSGGMLATPPHEWSESNWGGLFIVPLAVDPGPTTLKVVVQRARTASFVFEVPNSAKVKKKVRELKDRVSSLVE